MSGKLHPLAIVAIVIGSVFLCLSMSCAGCLALAAAGAEEGEETVLEEGEDLSFEEQFVLEEIAEREDQIRDYHILEGDPLVRGYAPLAGNVADQTDVFTQGAIGDDSPPIYAFRILRSWIEKDGVIWMEVSYPSGSVELKKRMAITPSPHLWVKSQ